MKYWIPWNQPRIENQFGISTWNVGPEHTSFTEHLKFGDGDGPNLCRVKKKRLVPHLLKIYFGLG